MVLLSSAVNLFLGKFRHTLEANLAGPINVESAIMLLLLLEGPLAMGCETVCGSERRQCAVRTGPENGRPNQIQQGKRDVADINTRTKRKTIMADF
jgi:hypothetical protein